MFEKLFARRGLSFDRLRVLLAVQEAGSIARAADGDPVRQSQYSRQLTELETFFGVELTVRIGRQLKLTLAGEEIAALARENLTSLDDFARKVAEDPAVYLIGAGESLIHWLVLPSLKEQTIGLPSVSLRLRNLRTDDIVQGLNDRTLDFGLLRDEAAASAFQRKRLGTMGYMLAVPEAMWRGLNQKTQDTQQLFARLPLALVGGTTGFGEGLRRQLKTAGIRAKVRLECDSFPSVARAIAMGRYAGILPDIAQHDRDLKGLVFVESKILAPLKRTVSLVWLPRRLKVRPLAPRVQQWLSFALTLASSRTPANLSPSATGNSRSSRPRMPSIRVGCDQLPE